MLGLATLLFSIAPFPVRKRGPRRTLVLEHMPSQVTPQTRHLALVKGIWLKPNACKLFPCKHLPLAKALERAPIFAGVQGPTRWRRSLLHLDRRLDPKDTGPCLLGNVGRGSARWPDVQVGAVVKLFGVARTGYTTCLQHLGHCVLILQRHIPTLACVASEVIHAQHLRWGGVFFVFVGVHAV